MLPDWPWALFVSSGARPVADIMDSQDQCPEAGHPETGRTVALDPSGASH